jgi:plasmid stability protein
VIQTVTPITSKCIALASKRYDAHMAAPKRSTIYFDPDIHRALRMKAAATERSMSEVVNEAVRQTLSEDAEDLEVFEKRRREASVSFDEVVLKLRRSGKI